MLRSFETGVAAGAYACALLTIAAGAISVAPALWLDGDTGGLIELDLPSGQRAGNTVDVWLRAIHFADLRNALVFRVLVFALGLVVTALSITGVYIWLRKRRARRVSAARGQLQIGATARASRSRLP